VKADEGKQERARWGLLLVLASAVAYGAMPILAKLAYAAGVRPVGLLAWRFLIAMLLFAVLRRRPAPALPLRRRLVLWGLGLVFVGNSLTYFAALELVPASLIALVLYTYPVLVMLFSAVAGLDPLTWRGVAAAALVFAGATLTAGQPAGSVKPGGIALTLGSAVIYALYIVLASRHAKDVPSETVAEHVTQACALVYMAWAIATAQLPVADSLRAWLLIAAIGLLCTVFALRWFMAGLARVGPSRAAVASSFEILVTIVLAVLVLGESVGLRQWAGGALIVAGVAFQNLVRKPGREQV
jgi:drug/metabolite transporter (DMT)-like permease